MHRRILHRFQLSDAEGSGSLLTALCINAFGAGMFYPFALVYFAGATSLGVGTIGFILTITTLITLVVTPVTGALVDRFGARRLVITSQVLEATGFAAYLLVSSAATLFVTSLLTTLASRMFFASFSTMIAEQSDGADRERWYGMVGVVQGLASTISGFVASLVISTLGMPGWRSVIVLNACFLVISAILLSQVPANRRIESGESTGGGYRRVLRDGAFVRIVSSNTLFILCSMLPGLGMAIFVSDGLHLPLWTVGALGIIQTGMTIGFQMRIIRSVEHIRRTRVMHLAGWMWVAACLLLASAILVPAVVLVPYLLLSTTCFAVARLLYVPTARSLAASLGPSSLQGRYVAMYEFSWGLARAMSPVLFGITFDLSPAAPWLAMSVVVLFAMFVLRSAETRIDASANQPLIVKPAP